MKIRLDFVTNSSSSSYICVAKVDKSNELLEYMKEEYGKYGLRLLDEYLVTGKEIKESYNRELADFRNDFGEHRILDTDTYLRAEFISWSNEGDVEGDDAWLYKHIPSRFMEEVYESDPD